MRQLGVVIASTREGRVGLPIAEWFAETARAEGSFEVTLVDLKAVDLPLLSEPHHPRLKRYAQANTLSWSTIVARLDAFVFVTPEYNHGAPPALVNALDHLYLEWNYKAAGFVSYGGVSAGTRSVFMTKSILNTLKIVPIPETVSIPFFSTLMDPQTGAFKGSDVYVKAAQVMLAELARWDEALRALRA